MHKSNFQFTASWPLKRGFVLKMEKWRLKLPVFRQACAKKAKKFAYLQICSRKKWKKLGINMFRIISPIKIAEPYKYASTKIMRINALQNIFIRVYMHVYAIIRTYTHLYGFITFWSKRYCFWPKPYKSISLHNKT